MQITRKDYLSMVENASNIEKLSYTIHFLKGNDDTGERSNDEICIN